MSRIPTTVPPRAFLDFIQHLPIRGFCVLQENFFMATEAYGLVSATFYQIFYQKQGFQLKKLFSPQF